MFRGMLDEVVNAIARGLRDDKQRFICIVDCGPDSIRDLDAINIGSTVPLLLETGLGGDVKAVGSLREALVRARVGIAYRFNYRDDSGLIDEISNARSAPPGTDIRVLRNFVGHQIATDVLSRYRHSLKTWIYFNRRYAEEYIAAPSDARYKRFMEAFRDPCKWERADLEVRKNLKQLECYDGVSDVVKELKWVAARFDGLRSIQLVEGGAARVDRNDRYAQVHDCFALFCELRDWAARA